MGASIRFFCPSPLDVEANAPGRGPADRTGGFLSEDRLIEVFGRLGNILHAENPLGKETDYRFYIEAVPGWLAEVMNLLECHKVYLYHRPEEFYLIKMFGDVDRKLTWIRFKTTAEGEWSKVLLSEAVGKKPRGFESHPLRHPNPPPPAHHRPAPPAPTTALGAD